MFLVLLSPLLVEIFNRFLPTHSYYHNLTVSMGLIEPMELWHLSRVPKCPPFLPNSSIHRNNNYSSYEWYMIYEWRWWTFQLATSPPFIDHVSFIGAVVRLLWIKELCRKDGHSWAHLMSACHSSIGSINFWHITGGGEFLLKEETAA